MKLEKLTLDNGIFKNKEGQKVKVKILSIDYQTHNTYPSFHDSGPKDADAYAPGESRDVGLMQPMFSFPLLYLKKL